MKILKKIIQLFLVSLLVYQPVFAIEIQWKESYILEAKGNYSQATQKMEGLDNKDEFALLRLGWLHYLQANYNDAKSYYKKALRKNPNSKDAQLGLIKPLLAQQRWLEAEKYNDKVLQSAPFNLSANLNQFAILEHNKNWRRLQMKAEYFTSRFPTDASTLVYLARAYAWQKKKVEAKRVYEKVLQRYTTNAEANYYIKNN